MKALILAAGYAVRLYPLTRKYPKPLLPVGKKPIINYIIDKLNRLEEIDEIIVVTNSKFISAFKRWKSRLKTAKKLSIIDDLTGDESDRRGAIGDMYFAISKKKISSDLLVIGGDNLFDEGLADFVGFAREKKYSPVIGIYDIKDRKKTSKYGVVKLDRQGRITDFREKPSHSRSTLVAMCLYYFPKGKLKLVGNYLKIKKNKKDATGFYINWLRKQVTVYGFIFDQRWYDIGDFVFYRQAQRKFSGN